MLQAGREAHAARRQVRVHMLHGVAARLLPALAARVAAAAALGPAVRWPLHALPAAVRGAVRGGAPVAGRPRVLLLLLRRRAAGAARTGFRPGASRKPLRGAVAARRWRRPPAWRTWRLIQWRRPHDARRLLLLRRRGAAVGGRTAGGLLRWRSGCLQAGVASCKNFLMCLLPGSTAGCQKIHAAVRSV